MVARTRSAVVVASFALVACGGARAEEPKAAAGSATSAAPGPVTSVKTEQTAEPAGKQKVDVEAEHRAFDASCLKQTKGAQEYCDCAWSQVKAVLGDDLAGRDDAEKPARVRAEVARSCASKVSEGMVKDGYIAGCVGDRAETEGYCACTWTEFRKQFSPGEMTDEQTMKGEKFASARRSAVKACGAKMPESVANEAFMKGCAKDPSATEFCTCAWKQLRKLGSPAEIEAGMIDEGKMRSSMEASCAKLRPKSAAGGAGAGVGVGVGAGGTGAGSATKPTASPGPKK